MFSSDVHRAWARDKARAFQRLAAGEHSCCDRSRVSEHRARHRQPAREDPTCGGFMAGPIGEKIDPSPPSPAAAIPRSLVISGFYSDVQ